MNLSNATIESYLLQIGAVKLSPEKPYTWSSGWLSPIYCDNRKILSFPKIRKIITQQFLNFITNKFSDVQIIAGVATGAIAHGILVADAQKLPFIYIRSKKKGHGLENQIEGVLHQGDRVVVIEDLISTGGSSIAAVEAVQNAGGTVLGTIAIFTYGFAQAEEKFQQIGCPLYTLANYNTLLEEALKNGYIGKHDIEILKEWRKDPKNWEPVR